MSNYAKMNPEVKALLVEALRYDQYAQGTGRLCRRPRTDGNPGDDYAFCCLGVLTDLAVLEGVPGVRWEPFEAAVADRNNITMPSREVKEWAGLGTIAAAALAGKNDQHWSFRRIATWIERHL